MKKCEQTKGQSVLEHGESVKEYLFDIIDHIRYDKPLKHYWKLPEWLYQNKETILTSLPDDDTLSLYTKFHDCGKPFCIEIDELGRKHFPNHANISYQIFNKVFDNQVASHLILHDMDIHLLKSKDVEEFSKLPNCITLLLTGLAEIHSNCKMFESSDRGTPCRRDQEHEGHQGEEFTLVSDGGLESTSFKIKYKSINQRGKQLFDLIKNKK
jgi:hypothetical protein